MKNDKATVGDVLLITGTGMCWIGVWWIHSPSAMIFIGVACMIIGALKLRSEQR